MATYTLITSTTISSNTGSVIFNNINTKYTDLVIRASVRTTGSGSALDQILIKINDDDQNVYSQIALIGAGTAVNYNKTSIDAYIYFQWVDGSTATANTFSNTEIVIPSYLAYQSKLVTTNSAQENNSATAYVSSNAATYVPAPRITKIELLPYLGSFFLPDSTFYLYGVFNGAESTPTAPTIGTATNGGTGTTASVAFTELSNNVGASYTVTSSPGSITATGISSPIQVEGLTPSTAYTFTVAANNPAGTGASSAASNSVTPTLLYGGYFGGNDSPLRNTIWKVGFASDTITVAAPVMALRAAGMAGASNNGTAGYWFGGNDSVNGFSGFIQKILFNSDVRSLLSATLNAPNRYLAGTSNSGTAGYTFGGLNSPSTLIDTIQKLLYSTEVRSNIASTLAAARRSMGSASNNGVAGYVAGGWDGSASTNVIQKLVYSSENRSTLSATLSAASFTLGGVSNSGTAAYFFGGNGLGATVNKLPYSTETRSTVSQTLTQAYTYATSASNNGTAGYLTGSSTQMSKFLYSNDTNTELASTFNVNVIDTCGFANTSSL